jgi:hypothetical protein
MRNTWQRLAARALTLTLVVVGAPAMAQTGSVLADFIPGGANGSQSGRGTAFDGTYLYYTLVGDSNIYKVATDGTYVSTIPVAAEVARGGPLAWDGSALWTMNYGPRSFVLYRVNPTNGSIISSCDLSAQNSSHPAVTDSPYNIGTDPDGMDWTGNTLWISSEAHPFNWIVESDTSCRILNAFRAPTGFIQFGTSGIAWDGAFLWHATPSQAQGTLIFPTDTSGVPTGFAFLAVGVTEDLAYDPVTFAPKCALWRNGWLDGPNHLSAHEIPCPEIKVPVDIKPQSCPNPKNVADKGVLTVAVLGTATFNVTQIDVSTIRLAGVSPLRSALGDVATPFVPFSGKKEKTDCTTAGPDGFLDLTLQFGGQAVDAALGPVTDAQVLVVELTGNLLPAFGGTPVVGEDVIVIIKKK